MHLRVSLHLQHMIINDLPRDLVYSYVAETIFKFKRWGQVDNMSMCCCRKNRKIANTRTGSLEEVNGTWETDEIVVPTPLPVTRVLGTVALRRDHSAYNAQSQDYKIGWCPFQ